MLEGCSREIGTVEKKLGAWLEKCWGDETEDLAGNKGPAEKKRATVVGVNTGTIVQRIPGSLRAALTNWPRGLQGRKAGFGAAGRQAEKVAGLAALGVHFSVCPLPR